MAPRVRPYKGVPSPSLLDFWPCSSVSPAPSLAGPSPSPAPQCSQLSPCLALPLLWEGPAAPCPGLAPGSPCGAGEARLLGFPGPLASRKSALEEVSLVLASGQLFSQTKVQGRRVGTPADLYSSISSFRPQRPGEHPQVRVGTGRRHWRVVRETCITPSWIRPPRLWSSEEGALWTSLLSLLVVCARRVWPGHSLDKGLQQRRPSPVGSWVARSRAVFAQSPHPACPGPDTSRNQRQERRCLEAFL